MFHAKVRTKMEFTKKDIEQKKKECRNCQWAASPDDLLQALEKIEQLQIVEKQLRLSWDEAHNLALEQAAQICDRKQNKALLFSGCSTAYSICSGELATEIRNAKTK